MLTSKELNILILEDIPIDAELVRCELERAAVSFTMRRVATKSKFLKELNEFMPDVILADFSLPQFTGLEALRHVRESGLDTPYILVTGTQREEVAVQCLKEGADDYILKSSLRRLPGALEKVLEKKEAERQEKRLVGKLEKSAKQMITIFESITDAFFAVDSSWQLMYLNPRSDLLLSKVNKRREDMLGRIWWDEFPAFRNTSAWKALQKAMTEQVFVQFEEFYPEFDLWLHLRAYPVEDGLSIYLQDVSERRREERTKEAVYKISEAANSERNINELFRRIHTIVGELIQANNFYIALYDSDNNIINYPYFVDESAERSGTEQIREGLTEYVLHRGQSFLASPKFIQELVALGEIDFEGTEVPWWLGVPLKTGHGVIGIIAVQQYAEHAPYTNLEKGILEYVSAQAAIAIEHKQAEHKILEQASLLDIAQDAILVHRLDATIIYWNRSAERIYGWSKKEALGQNINRLLDANDDAIVNAFKSVTEKGNWFGEMRHLTKEKKEVIVESRWSLVLDDHGTPESILVINTDITEIKRLQCQSIRAQRLESMGTLASGIAHDLNNVLSPITMSIPLLKEKLTDPSMNDILETLQISAKRGEGIVKQILSFVRGRDGENMIIQIRHLINDLVMFLGQTFPPSIAVRTKSGKDIWPLLGDATQLYQVLLNLAINARDAMPNGGTLLINVQNTVIDERMRLLHGALGVERFVMISVKDTGSGISKDILDKIFDPFFTTKGHEKGTGLGLSIIHTIVKNHGGFVEVESTPGKGSEFIVYLPAKEASDIHDHHSEQKLPGGNGETILVVDDESCVLELIGASLKNRKYKVITASDGAEAVALYAQKRGGVDLVIIDMLMPVMDGPTTVRALNVMDPKVKIIGMSGFVGDKQKGDADFPFADLPFIQKPFDVEQLLFIIDEVLHAASGPRKLASLFPR